MNRTEKKWKRRGGRETDDERCGHVDKFRNVISIVFVFAFNEICRNRSGFEKIHLI